MSRGSLRRRSACGQSERKARRIHADQRIGPAQQMTFERIASAILSGNASNRCHQVVFPLDRNLNSLFEILLSFRLSPSVIWIRPGHVPTIKRDHRRSENYFRAPIKILQFISCASSSSEAVKNAAARTYCNFTALYVRRALIESSLYP